MLARIVENWLTRAGEIGYQAAFVQLLISEGHRVLHAAVHHPFEHGKDTVSIGPDGTLLAFQLKGGNIGLRELEDIQGQLMALVATAVTYPGVEPPRRPDRAFLVTNGQLSPPARDRLQAINTGNRTAQLPIIELVEREQLVGRFVSAHGSFSPTEPGDLSQFLSLVLKEGTGPFPVADYARFVKQLTSSPAALGSVAQASRSIASVTLLTAYITGPWERAENHLGIAEAWLSLTVRILEAASVSDLEPSVWSESFLLARDSSRAALRRLLNEASERDDLVIPDIVEGVIYPVRAAIICGYLSAFFLSERELGDAQDIAAKLSALLKREVPYVRAPGEAASGHILMIATAFEILNDSMEAATLMTKLALDLVRANRVDSSAGVADPYHTIEEVLLSNFTPETPLSDEQFVGQAYTLHIAIEWLVRRGYRDIVAELWPLVTRLHFCEFRPSSAANILSFHDSDGGVATWAPAMPQSWAKLFESARSVAESSLPVRLWQQLGVLPYLPLVYPHRLTSATAKALDHMVSNRCEVQFEDEATAGILESGLR